MATSKSQMEHFIFSHLIGFFTHISLLGEKNKLCKSTPYFFSEPLLADVYDEFELTAKHFAHGQLFLFLEGIFKRSLSAVLQ